MRGTKSTHSVRRERGAAAIELAIVLPLLLLIIAGIVDFGRFFLTDIQLTNAAREGARAAIVSELDVESRVRAAAPSVAGLTVAIDACTGPGTEASVTAAQPDFEWILLEPALNILGGAGALPPAESEAVMRCEA